MTTENAAMLVEEEVDIVYAPFGGTVWLKHYASRSDRCGRWSCSLWSDPSDSTDLEDYVDVVIDISVDSRHGHSPDDNLSVPLSYPGADTEFQEVRARCEGECMRVCEGIGAAAYH